MWSLLLPLAGVGLAAELAPGGRALGSRWHRGPPAMLRAEVAARSPGPGAALSRREVGVLAAAAAFRAPDAARAAPPSAEAAVTDKVRLEFLQQLEGSSGETRSLAVTVGLFGRDAPRAVAAFKEAARGELRVPCGPEPDLSSELMARGQLSKKGAYKDCLAAEQAPVTYAYSQVWSIQRGRRIDAGAVQGKFALRAAPETDPAEGLRHDAPGLLSVRRGGGSFDFGITTAPTPEDDADFVVIGRVLEGMEAVQELDAAPVVKAAGFVNAEASAESRGKSCFYGSANAYCAQNKPLRKVVLRSATVL